MPVCLGTVYLTIAHAPLGQESSEPLFVFLTSIRYMLVRIGIKYMAFAHARLLSKWNFQYFRAVLCDFCFCLFLFD